jgi:hypothetical protein
VEKLLVVQVVKRLPAFTEPYGSSPCPEGPATGPDLVSQMNQVHILKSYVFEIHFFFPLIYWYTFQMVPSLQDFQLNSVFTGMPFPSSTPFVTVMIFSEEYKLHLKLLSCFTKQEVELFKVWNSGDRKRFDW